MTPIARSDHFRVGILYVVVGFPRLNVQLNGKGTFIQYHRKFPRVTLQLISEGRFNHVQLLPDIWTDTNGRKNLGGFLAIKNNRRPSEGKLTWRVEQVDVSNFDSYFRKTFPCCRSLSS